ncbi:putative toxin-antitoxin system toxin component, PIN family [Patescibacteria group bacterium]|nr:putative toxin-antitoxin system toxin component, PIN family [Patescibacteria group bacterium]
MVKNRVFLDSSVIISALLSSEGGSFHILYYFKNVFEFQINEYVFDEVLNVLDEKFSDNPQLKNKFFTLIGLMSVRVLPDVSKSEVKFLEKFLSKEDAPILAAALKYSSYLLTLDNDFLTDLVLKFASNKNLSILKPKEFIQIFRNLKSR